LSLPLVGGDFIHSYYFLIFILKLKSQKNVKTNEKVNEKLLRYLSSTSRKKIK